MSTRLGRLTVVALLLFPVAACDNNRFDNNQTPIATGSHTYNPQSEMLLDSLQRADWPNPRIATSGDRILEEGLGPPIAVVTVPVGRTKNAQTCSVQLSYYDNNGTPSHLVKRINGKSLHEWPMLSTADGLHKAGISYQDFRKSLAAALRQEKVQC